MKKSSSNFESSLYPYAYLEKLRPDKGEVASFYHNYLDLVPSENILTVLEQQVEEIAHYFDHLSVKDWDFAYAKDKWTVKQVLQHLIDTERVMAYRALRISRGDSINLPSYDHNEWANQAKVEHRKGEELVREYREVRKSTLSFFKSLHEKFFHRKGIVSHNPATPLALAFIIAGHERHHLNILSERYEPFTLS